MGGEAGSAVWRGRQGGPSAPAAERLSGGPPFRIAHGHDTVAGLHASLPRSGRRERLVRLCRPSDTALVIGSTQDQPLTDDVAIVRRRSGGGAVLVEPGFVVWADVFVPAGDALWSDDVGHAFLWLGDTWATALAQIGVDDLDIHTDRARGGSLARLVCFAGMGPGEVTAAQAKVVGLCQRRTREGSLFQCAVLRRWEPERYARLLDLDEAPAEALARLPVAVVEAPVEAIEAAFLDALSRVVAAAPGAS